MKSLFGIPFHYVEDTNWKVVYRESEKQAVIIPVFFHYDKLPLGKELKSEIGQSVNQCIGQCIQNYSYHDYLHPLLKDYGTSMSFAEIVWYIPIKDMLDL